MTSLNLSGLGSTVSDTIVEFLSKRCTKVLYLFYISQNKICFPILNYVYIYNYDPILPQLTALDISGCHHISDQATRILVKSLGERLLALNFSQIPQLTDESLRILSQSCPQLRTLQVRIYIYYLYFYIFMNQSYLHRVYS